jgi:hypothetical protein
LHPEDVVSTIRCLVRGIRDGRIDLVYRIRAASGDYCRVRGTVRLMFGEWIGVINCLGRNDGFVSEGLARVFYRIFHNSIVPTMIALEVAFMLATGTVMAQTCPTYPPRLSGDGFYITRASGCNSGPNCVPEEPVRFNPVSHLNSPFQQCDTFRWDFGDGTIVETVGARSVEHTYTLATFREYSSFRVRLTVKNAMGEVGGYKDVTYRVAECDPYYAHQGSLDGATVGCGTDRPCKVGDAVQIVAEYAGTDARYCDGYTVDFGDHSPEVTVAATSQAPSPAVLTHQFARDGIYSVIVKFGRLGPPPTSQVVAPAPLSVTIPVRVQATGRRRAAGR